MQRTYGTSPGEDPERVPLDLYVGIDCSGSMVNPRQAVSYPVLAGCVIALSALRAGARVMAVLSGDPGPHSATAGFVDNEREVLRILTGYLGTGYAFGIPLLADAFAARRPTDRPAHILIVSDHDIFAMLDEKTGGRTGWQIAQEALAAARGGGTFVLHMPPEWEPEKTARLRAAGLAGRTASRRGRTSCPSRASSAAAPGAAGKGRAARETRRPAARAAAAPARGVPAGFPPGAAAAEEPAVVLRGRRRATCCATSAAAAPTRAGSRASGGCRRRAPTRSRATRPGSCSSPAGCCTIPGSCSSGASPPRRCAFLERGLAGLAALVQAERFVDDPDRREELARAALAALDLRPQGETEPQARDRRTTLDSVERHAVLQKTRAAEERARQVREAMARKAAQEAAASYGRE